MALPKHGDIKIPLPEELVRRGGGAEPANLYEPLALHFRLDAEDLQETVGEGRSRWEKRVQAVRQDLMENGFINRLPYGVGCIAEKGRYVVDSTVIIEGE